MCKAVRFTLKDKMEKLRLDVLTIVQVTDIRVVPDDMLVERIGGVEKVILERIGKLETNDKRNQGDRDFYYEGS